VPQVTVGPVIGKVGHNTARVLIEIDANATVVCTASSPEGQQVKQSLAIKQNRPAAFQLNGLKEQTRYDVRFEGVDNDRRGRLKTLAASPTRMNIGAVSCNFTIRRADTNLWVDLRDRYVNTGELDLLLHVGDQVYGDNAFHEAQAILSDLHVPAAARDDCVRELYRRLYRLTWNDPATQAVLANVPNLMIWDDHEIRDDWGSLEADKDPDSLEHKIGTLARQVFQEYQRQLWYDGTGSNGAETGLECHFHRWGPVGVICLDQRGGRSFTVDPTRPYLGAAQWKALEELLAPDGTFSAVRALIVVTPIPLVYLSPTLVKLGNHFMDDLMDHWCYGPHRKEQIELIRLLRYWKERGAGEKEVLVVGGDVHIGGQADIKHRGKIILKQLITSTITNTPPSSFEFHGLRLLLEAHQQLGHSYSCEHHDLTNLRNFGVILVRIPEQGTPLMEGSLVEAVPKAKMAASGTGG